MCTLSESVKVRRGEDSLSSTAIERVDELESFSGSELQLERFLLGEN